MSANHACVIAVPFSNGFRVKDKKGTAHFMDRVKFWKFRRAMSKFHTYLRRNDVYYFFNAEVKIR